MFNKNDRRANNVKIFEDTVENINNNEKLQESVKESIKTQKLYLETDSVQIPEVKNLQCKTVVSIKRSFEAASAYAKEGKKVCVLNFASATNPGGGVVNGSSAQEEALCRCSTLYPCLNVKEFWDGFYQPHRNAGNPLYNDDVIYTPRVTVFKSDVSYPKKMLSRDWYQVDVLTCAAPNLRHMPSNYMNPFAGDEAADIGDGDLMKLHLKRIDKIFRVAVENGAQVLVLGAFGCGAFCNPPELVAKAFKTVQDKYKEYFVAIEYAIFCMPRETQNYDAFCNEFNEQNLNACRK